MNDQNNETPPGITPLPATTDIAGRIELFQRQCGGMSFRHAQETVAQHDAYLEERLGRIMAVYKCSRDSALQTLQTGGAD